MREIKFRGKRLDNGEWVKGFAVKRGSEWWIDNETTDWHSMPPLGKIQYRKFKVDPATVGQFTGFVDFKKQEIYKDSICRYRMDVVWKVGYIIWHQGGFAIRVTRMGDIKTSRIFNFQTFIPTPDKGNVMGDQFEVIGNIHDNPELLKGEAND